MAPHPHEKPHHPHGLVTAALFFFVFLLGLFSVHEASTWIHIKTGARIMADRAIPQTDPFSYTMNGRPWTTGSWLADVLFYALHKGFGPEGLIVFKSFVAAGAFAMLVPISAGSPLTAAIVLALGAAACWTGFTEKPAIFDLIFLAWLIRLLRPRKPFRWQDLIQLAAVELLWANLHGARAVIGVWIVLLKTFKVLMRTTQRERLKYVAAPAAALLGFACNPLGLGLLGRSLSGLGTYGSAWQPLSPWVNLYVLFALVGAGCCLVVLQQEFLLAMTAATMLVLSLLVPSLRAAYVIVACPVIALAAGHLFAPKPIKAIRLAWWLSFAAFLFWLHWSAIYVPMGSWRGYGAVSLDGALHFLADNGVRGRMFDEAEAGDHIIGGSDRSVFFDDRLAFYGAYDPGLAKDAAHWTTALPALTEGYHFDYAVVLNRRAVYPARVLDQDPAWRLAYADDAALVYLRRFGANAALVDTLPQRLLAPNRLWPDALDDLLRSARLRPKALAELDRWIIEAPDAVQPLIWKAYALDRLNLSEKAERWISMAERRRVRFDPELLSQFGFFYARRRDYDRADRFYLEAEQDAGRRSDAALRAQILRQLAWDSSGRGAADRTREYEERAKRSEEAAVSDD